MPSPSRTLNAKCVSRRLPGPSRARAQAGSVIDQVVVPAPRSENGTRPSGRGPARRAAWRAATPVHGGSPQATTTRMTERAGARPRAGVPRPRAAGVDQRAPRALSAAATRSQAACARARTPPPGLRPGRPAARSPCTGSRPRLPPAVRRDPRPKQAAARRRARPAVAVSRRKRGTPAPARSLRSARPRKTCPLGPASQARGRAQMAVHLYRVAAGGRDGDPSRSE